MLSLPEQTLWKLVAAQFRLGLAPVMGHRTGRRCFATGSICHVIMRRMKRWSGSSHCFTIPAATVSIKLLPDGRKATSSFMKQAITSQLEAIDGGLRSPKKANFESALRIYQGTLSQIGSLYSQYSNPQIH